MAMLGSGIDFNKMAMDSMNNAAKEAMSAAAIERENAAKQALGQMKAMQDEEKERLTGQQKTRQLLARGIKETENYASKEAGRMAGGGKFDMIGNLVGIDPDQSEMYSFLKPAVQVRGLLSRSGVIPEYSELAKQQVSQSYGLTDKKAVNRRLNLLNKLPEAELIKSTEALRKGNAAKWWEFLGMAKPPEAKGKGDSSELKYQYIEKKMQELEKKYKVSDLDPTFSTIEIKTITPELMNDFIDNTPEEGEGVE